jgi:MHS family alpha-ketoglutarate permease-like MFS transporter
MTSLQRLRNVLGGSAGNFVEWYDWFVYAAFAIYFSAAIFPGGDQTTQLLKAYLPFTLGFVARPLGACVMGLYVDRVGRRAGLALSVSMMCVGSLMISVLPTHAQAGAMAPVILTFARILQGLSVGGEYGASATYVSEMATKRRRGFWSGFLYMTVIAGQLAALLTLVILQQILTEAQLQAWGWRVAFALGALLGVVVFWIRLGLAETPAFKARGVEAMRGHTLMLVSHHPKESGAIFILTAGGGSAFYFYTTYLKDFLVNSAAGPAGSGFSKEDAALITTALLVCFMLLQPVVGALSDKVGRKVTLTAGFGASALIAYPATMAIMNATSGVQAFVMSLPPLLALSAYTSVSAIFKAEMFPTHLRALGVSLPYALAQALFGGNVSALALAFKKAGHESPCSCSSPFYWARPS